MSSYNKDPLEKQDTPSESSESHSHSDSDMDEAEENMELLKIGERQTKETTKDVSGGSKPLDFASQGGPSISKREPIAGPSGLQTCRLRSSGGIADPEAKVANLTDPEKDEETKVVGAELQESLSTSDEYETRGCNHQECLESNPDYSSGFIQSSTGITDSRILDHVTTTEGLIPQDDVDQSIPPECPRDDDQSNPPECPQDDDDDQLKPPDIPMRRKNTIQYFKSSSSKRYAFATDSANTSSDVSEIRSEIADISAGGSLYLEAVENFEKERSPSYASALSRQASEASEANISDIQEDPSSHSGSSSRSKSTPSSEEGHEAYCARILKEAEERKMKVSTSSGIGSTDLFELHHRQAWQAAGERAFYRNDADDPNQDIPNRGVEPQRTSQPTEDAEISGEQQIQDYKYTTATRKTHAEMRPEVRREGSGSTSKRRSEGLRDLSKSEKGVPERLRSRSNPDTGKMEMVASKSSPDMQSSSESTEPKSSSSDDSHRKESREIKGSSKTKEFSKSMERRSFQKRGNLLGMKHPTISSLESSIPEDDEECESPLREQGSERMETTSDKGHEGAAESSEPLVSKPSRESSDQAYGSEVEGTSRKHGDDFQVSDFERYVGKSKRGPKLSNSPPSDEKVGSLPPKSASRPKKKARSDKVPVRTLRTRHDAPESSDDSESGSEKETAL